MGIREGRDGTGRGIRERKARYGKGFWKGTKRKGMRRKQERKDRRKVKGNAGEKGKGEGRNGGKETKITGSEAEAEEMRKLKIFWLLLIP